MLIRMISSAWGAACLFAVCCLPASLLAGDEDIPSPDAKTATEIIANIKQLGDESYATREAATEKLLSYGLPALKLVEEGTKDADREVRYRCERIRVLLREIDLQRRLDDFAADLKGEKDHGLPAWDRFAELHGGSSEARQLFVDIFKAEPDLLKTMQLEIKKTGDLLTNRVFQMQQDLQTQQPLSLGNVAGVIFAASQDGVDSSDQTQQMIYNFCHQPAFREAITQGPKQPVVRSLLAKFIVRGEGWVAYQGLNLAMQYDLKEGLEPARKLVKSRGAGQPHLLQMSLLALAKMGNQEELPIMQELLDDKTVIMNFQINNQRIQCQVRDFALLGMLHLLAKDKERVKGTPLESGDLKAFGFDRLEANAMQLYAPHTIGFVNDEKRDEMFKKWDELKTQLKIETKTPEKEAEDKPAEDQAEAVPAIELKPAIRRIIAKPLEAEIIIEDLEIKE